uniref:Thioredoxin domain-containing protein n=1 Tax=Leersia perrieri TaxID=77586 RepID=A0A0D9WHR7_9ORYZ
MGCCGSSTIDAEEHLDYSAGNVTVILDQISWESKMEEVAELGKTVVVKFSATWCGPCRNAAPLFAELSVKHPEIVFMSVDVDEMPGLVTQFDIRATPTFIFMKDKEIDKLVGGNHEDLQDKFEQLYRPKLYDDLGQDGGGLIAAEEEIGVAKRGGGGEAAPLVGAPLRDELGGQVPAPAGVQVQDLQVGSPASVLPPPVEVVAGGLELGVEVLEP